MDNQENHGTENQKVTASGSLTALRRDQKDSELDREFRLSAEIDILRPREKWQHASKWFKVIAVVVPLLWVYQQYLESNYRSRIDQAEQELRVATDQLASSSSGIAASGVRTVYDLAFRELPPEPHASWYSPPVNLIRWLAGRRERRLLDRSRDLFREFAATPRAPSPDKKDAVSTAILKTAIEWVSRETILLGKSPQDPSLWFLYRAKLSKAYAPSSRLEGFQFYDVDLSHAILNSSNLSHAYLERSNLEEAGLESCVLFNANLIKANLRKARLNFANLDSAKLQYADLTEADLTLAVLSRANLSGTNLSKVTLRTADLQEAVLAGADLNGANLSQANVRQADFTNANLAGADFRFTNGIAVVKSWQGARLAGALFPPNFSPKIGGKQ